MSEDLYSDIKNDLKSSTVLLTRVQDDIAKAHQLVQYHPLVMFLQAMVYNKQNLAVEAIDEYQRLIDLIAPHDPKRKINIGSRPVGDNALEKERRREKLSGRTQMNLTEYVCGRKQFSGIIDLARIQMGIASAYENLGESALRVTHLLEAVRESRFDDLNLDNFLRLANQLNNIERHSEALSILDAAKYPRQHLGRAQLSQTKSQTLDILRCTIEARSQSYAEALQRAKAIATAFDIKVQTPSDADKQALEPTFKSKLCGDQTEPSTNDPTEGFLKLFDQANTIVCNHQSELKSTIERICDNLDLGEWRDKTFSLYDTNADFDFSSLYDFMSHFHQMSEIKFPPTNEDISDAEDDTKGFMKIFSRVFREDFEGENTSSSKQNGNAQIIQKNIDTIAKRARIALNAEDRKEGFKRIGSVQQVESELNEDFQKIILSQMVMYISREYSNKISQMAELLNTLAYSRAELGLRFPHAYNDSAAAVILMLYLVTTADRESRYRKSFTDKLAQFFDTFGWARYRYCLAQMAKGDPSGGDNLQEYDNEQITTAEKYLRRGVRYDVRRAILHYHLARVYQTRIEMQWQLAPDIRDNDEKLAKRAAIIDTAITQAWRHWRNAKRYDKHGRLHSQLSWLYNRINSYRNAWAQRQFKGIAGEDQIMPLMGDE